MTDKERIEKEVKPAFRVDVCFENEDGTMRETKTSQFVITEGDAATLFVKVPNHFFNQNQKAVEALQKVKEDIRKNNFTPDRIRNMNYIDQLIKELGGKDE